MGVRLPPESVSEIAGIRSPDERFGGIVVGCDELLDGGDQLRHTAEGSTTNAFVSQFAEPALDQVEPRRGGGCEVEMEARMLGEPALHLGMVVGAVVVEDHVYGQVGRD